MKFSHSSSFHFLNSTQFLGVLNENIFKLLVIFFLIQLQGIEHAPKILATAGAIFVIPFLLFSSAAGILADKFSKRNILIYAKGAEVLFMLLSILAIAFQSEFFLYALLFLLSAQGALFGPSKYGILPELLTAKEISLANGILTASTFLAIIFGTFLASFILDITNKNFFIASLFCACIAFVGFFLSFKISKTPGKKSETKISFFFPREIYKTLVLSKKTPHLFSAILGSAFFLSIGSFVQLNTIPFAIESLHLSEVGGGYLFLTTAFGIAGGSWLAGKISKDREFLLGLSLVSGIGLSILLLLLSIFAKCLFCDLFLFVLLGVCGGLFLIPFDSFLQIKSPDSYRGQIIATANFLSFVGVLLSSFCIYFFSSILHLSAAMNFAVIGVLTLLFTLYATKRLHDIFFPFLAQKILFRNSFPKANNFPPQEGIIFLKKGSFLSLFALLAILPNLKIFTRTSWYSIPFFGFLNTFYSFSKNSKIFQKFEKEQVCLFLKNFPERDEFEKLFPTHPKIFTVSMQEEKSFFHFFQRRDQLIITFTEEK